MRVLLPRLGRSSLAFGLFCALVAPLARGADDETARAKTQLQRQIVLISRVRPYVERGDLGRLLVLDREARRALEAVEKKGLRHFETTRQYQTLIVSWRYSEDFLSRIRTNKNADALGEARRITAEIVSEIGFDDSPYTRITANTFTQAHKLVQSLLQLSLDDKLKAKLQDLIPVLGVTIATAGEGDRPRAFEAGKTAYQRVAALYADFDKVGFSHAAYEIVLQLQGLNEFYAEFAQIHRAEGEKK